jgi:hypothetical protein
MMHQCATWSMDSGWRAIRISIRTSWPWFTETVVSETFPSWPGQDVAMTIGVAADNLCRIIRGQCVAATGTSAART